MTKSNNQLSPITVYTLDARDNVMLEVTRDYLNVPPARMHRDIQAYLRQTVEPLEKKGITYKKLKSALVPHPKRHEMALFFDTTRIEDSFYGHEIFQKVIPLFSKDSNHSVLDGDYRGENKHQGVLYEALAESVLLIRDVRFKHSSQFFVVYISNMTPRMMEKLHEGLRNYEPYIGFADMTYASRMKILLSTMLCNAFIKHGRIILGEHEDDRPDDENINLSGYPFEENGYVCKSIAGSPFGVFLSYKIERPVIEGFEMDTEFSLNAVSPMPMPLEELELEIDEEKFAYLLREKARSLEGIGMLDKDHTELNRLIAERIRSNYIYNMNFDPAHETTKFNILLDVKRPDNAARFRVMVALKYNPDEKRLRLITLH